MTAFTHWQETNVHAHRELAIDWGMVVGRKKYRDMLIYYGSGGGPFDTSMREVYIEEDQLCQSLDSFTNLYDPHWDCDMGYDLSRCQSMTQRLMTTTLKYGGERECVDPTTCDVCSNKSKMVRFNFKVGVENLDHDLMIVVTFDTRPSINEEKLQSLPFSSVTNVRVSVVCTDAKLLEPVTPTEQAQMLIKYYEKRLAKAKEMATELEQDQDAWSLSSSILGDNDGGDEKEQEEQKEQKDDVHVRDYKAPTSTPTSTSTPSPSGLRRTADLHMDPVLSLPLLLVLMLMILLLLLLM